MVNVGWGGGGTRGWEEDNDKEGRETERAR